MTSDMWIILRVMLWVVAVAGGLLLLCPLFILVGSLFLFITEVLDDVRQVGRRLKAGK